MEQNNPTNNLQQASQPIMRKMPKDSKKQNIKMVLSAVVVVFFGIGTGWLLSQQTGASSANVQNVAPGVKETSTEAGKILDEENCRDTAKGVLESGGMDGEGTHHLVTSEDESKWVYLTSTVIDLESFTGKEVQIWGETIAPQKVGWLMDVCKIKVI